MKEIGVVTAVNGKKATVKVDKKDECSKCGMCLFPKNASSVEFEAENQVDAKIGDTVLFQTEKDGKLLGAILVFLVPLILIGLSAVLAYLVVRKEIWTLIFSLIFIVAWFFVLALIDKKLKKTTSFRPSIISVCQENSFKKEK
ncbi:MAG: SoxR reducing system RseC family protein [Clostridia bacterium]|nr:SoxR reducing system RseC family protein [Clostridia bacterium]